MGKSAAAKPTKGQSKPATRRPRVRPTIEKRTPLLQRVRQSAWHSAVTVVEPAFWKGLARQLPPWTSEIAAILLMVLGVVALNALLNTTSQAPLAVTLSRVLRQLCGGAAYMVALGLIGVGTLILVSRFGRPVRLSWAQVTGIELAFVALAAWLHWWAHDPEPRVLAREGNGGGYLGWVVTALLGELGRGAQAAILALMLVASAILIVGLRLRHLALAIRWLRSRLEAGVARLEQGGDLDLDRHDTNALINRDPEWPDDPPDQDGTGNGGLSAPAERTGSPNPPSRKLSSSAPDNTQRSHMPSRRLTRTQRQELVSRARGELGAANGRSLVAPGGPAGRPSVVPPELHAAAPVNGARGRGRGGNVNGATRYFTVEDFREARKVGKRDPNLPPLELLSDLELNVPTEEEINTNAHIIRHTLLEFDVETEVIDVKVGPTVTMYAVSPYTEQLTEDGERVVNRVRVNEITHLNGDLALALSAKRLRIQAPVPGQSYVGIEVPNRQPSTVALRPVLESEAFYRYRNRPLAIPLGRDTAGAAFVADLATMPHLLIAGTTGSGKSIMLAAMTTALVMNNTPDRVRLVLLDPKMVELSRFNGLPHLLGPVETELDRIVGVLRWATREMDRRYRLLEKEAARNIDTYNAALGRRRADEHLPYIVIIMDEIGDLMMQRPDETERTLTRLAQMARAVGMHLVVATQRPSVDVITGLIKANFPARISFAVASGIDSRVILDTTGAESLMGRGDMLFLAPDAAGPQRIQGCYVSDEEVNAVVSYWKQWHAAQIEAGAMEPVSVGPWERGMTRREVLAETDPMLEEAIALVIEEGEASASLIQRRLGLGYPRAARIIDLLHELGIVGAAKPGGRSRDVLVKPGADPFERILDKRLQNRK
ncbi:MAG: DNA translocase FtsK [Aggregatilineaceae bacterium]